MVHRPISRSQGIGNRMYRPSGPGTGTVMFGSVPDQGFSLPLKFPLDFGESSTEPVGEPARATLSIGMPIALLGALTPAYAQARATLDDISPTTITANALFAAGFVAILGIAIVRA